jgi:hypothetical protein
MVKHANFEGKKQWNDKESGPSGVNKNRGKTKKMSYFEKHKQNLLLAEKIEKETQNENISATTSIMTNKSKNSHLTQQKENNSEPARKSNILHKIRKENERGFKDFQQQIIIKRATVGTHVQFEAKSTVDGSKNQHFDVDVALSIHVVDTKPKKIENIVPYVKTTNYDTIFAQLEKIHEKKLTTAHHSKQQLTNVKLRLLNDINRTNKYIIDILELIQDHQPLNKNNIQVPDNELCLAEAQGLLYRNLKIDDKNEKTMTEFYRNLFHK